MSSHEPKLPLRGRALNGIGLLAELAGRPVARFDTKLVKEYAQAMTGLEDFGASHYEAGLETLISSAHDDAHLTFLGRRMIRNMVVNFLAQRLYFVEAHRQQATANVQLESPLIVTGLWRSGTTLLHRLLSLDPQHRSVPYWEQRRPIPPSLIGQNSEDERHQQAVNDFEYIRKYLVNQDSIHYVRADTPEECIVGMGLTFFSMFYWVIAPVYGYLDWYLNHNEDLAYREYGHLLKLWQCAKPGKRLTLKAPMHTPFVSSIWQHVPEAMIVHIHRDPAVATTSMNSLIYSSHASTTNRNDRAMLAKANLKMIDHALSRNQQVREQFPQRIFDIDYNDLMANPVATVRRIHNHFELPWSDELNAKAIRTYLENNPKGKHGRHKYEPADFGQSQDRLQAHFHDYRSTFPFK